MQWDDSPNGGFTTTTKAWFAVNPNYKVINAKQALADQNSIYHYFRKMLELRKQTPALIYVITKISTRRTPPYLPTRAHLSRTSI